MEENYIDKEIDEIIEKFKNYVSLDGLRKRFSRANYEAIEPFEVELSHQTLSQAEAFLHDGHEIQLPSLIDLDPIFLSLEKGSVLSPIELFNVLDLLLASESIYDLFQDKKQYERLYDNALDLVLLPSIKKELSIDLEPDFTVSDNASIKLKEIREKKRALERNLSGCMTRYKNKYLKYLSNDAIQLKGDEETLPVKTMYKNSIRGMIVSYSSSGETAFIVPYEVVEMKNELRRYQDEENTEVMKILSDLSKKCSRQLVNLRKNHEILMFFDRYFASVRFGHEYQGTIATQSKNELSLNALFHPLLKAKKVVENSLSLGKDKPKALLITGPNAGGKSVFIKAVALAVRMDKLGFFVPTHDVALIPFIDHVYFLGGDNQSVLDNLSTFSSHLYEIKKITENATEKSLVIIDEVGEGTSPRDGEALGVGILKFFEKTNCFTLLTSHFDGLKFYAAQDEKCITAAMEFNGTALIPTYRLLLNTTGRSYGIILAKNMGLNSSIIDEAIQFQEKQSNQDIEGLMEKLTEQESRNKKLERDLINKKKDLDKAIEKREKAIQALNEERGQIHQKAQEKVDRLVEKRIAEMDAVWKSKQNSDNGSYNEFSKAKGELKKIKEVEEPTLVGKGETMLTDIKPGDLLEDEDGRRTTVLEIKKNEVMLDMDGLRFRRSIKGLKRATKRTSDLNKKPKQSIDKEFVHISLADSKGIELNIIGLHVDEAMREVVSFIDEARVRKLGYIRIVHGMGSFALKKAVWKYLDNHKSFFKDYSLGGEGDGGMGATIIHLK